jgi:hypothetical protein
VRPPSARELRTLLVAVVPGFANYHSLTDVEEAERDPRHTARRRAPATTRSFGYSESFVNANRP